MTTQRPEAEALRVPRAAHGFAFDPGAAPVARVSPGTTLVVETYDCFSNKVSSPSQVFERESDLFALIGSYNPVTGPIYVEGAEPGDLLEVRVERIQLGTFAPYAVTAVTGDSKGVCGAPTSLIGQIPDTRVCPIDSDAVVLPTGRGDIRLPLRPMIGSIGTAPAHGASSSLEFGLDHGGNVDCPDLTVGATVALPVNVPGALLWLGDVHAAMGDAEITGTALETNADVTITIDVIPRRTASSARQALPRLDSATMIGSLGCEFGASVETNLRHAFVDLLGRLSDDYGLAKIDAYHLLGAAARVRVNQCVAGGWTATRVSVARSVLPEPAP